MTAKKKAAARKAPAKKEAEPASTAPKWAPPPDTEFIYDVEQRSREWFDLHLGVPTASRFAAIMADGDGLGRRSLLQTLAGEIITGIISETFQSEAMRRGVEMEPYARDDYAKRRFDEVTQIGFVRRKLPSGRWIGCSPDAQVGDRRGLEIKTERPQKILAVLDNPLATWPKKHKAQVQGVLLITGWESVDLLLFYKGEEGHEDLRAEFTVVREERYIEELWKALQVFDFDLHQKVKDYRTRMR